MTTDNKDHPDDFLDQSGNSNRQPSPYDSDVPDTGQRREPTFGAFDERSLEEYEEPDRDSTIVSSYGSNNIAEEEEFDLFADEDELETLEADSDIAPESLSTTSAAYESEELPEEDPEEWQEEDEFYETDDEGDSGWPLRMMIVAAVAVALVTAGVYGVLQERAATEAELRDLRATLATSANQEELRITRDNLRALQQSRDALLVEAEALSEENRQLKESVAALESKPAPAKPEQQAAKPAPATPPPKATTPPPPAQAPAVTPSGRWFVNFGSYSARDAADSWASRLRPERGEVIVVPGAKDGKTYYRVRVVGLDSKDSADLVARQLEAEQQVTRLWVGQE